MKLEINAEQIDELVRDTIMKTAIGGSIEEAIKKSLSGYNSPVDDAIKTVVREMLVEILHTEYKDELKAAILVAIEARLSEESLQKIACEDVTKIERAASDRY